MAYYGYRGCCPPWIDYEVDIVYSDDDIREMVEDNIELDPLIPMRDVNSIKVEVNEGIVTLSGKVRSRRSKINAYTDAFWTSGVVDVDNQVEVKERESESQK